MKKIASSACAALVALCGMAFAGGEGWIQDFEAAKKQATETKKDLLLDFTGSDWCPLCVELEKEVFSQDAFKTGVKDSFVLVELDLPRGEKLAAQSAEIQKQNKELALKYGIKPLPGIVLCDNQGRPFAYTTYQEGGPEKYVKHLNELRTHKAKRDEALAAAAKLEGMAKAKALVAALAAMEIEDNAMMTFYGDVIEQIKAADPKDETGFGKKQDSKLKVMELYKTLQESATDDQSAFAIIEKALKDDKLLPEDSQKIIMTKAMIYAQMHKLDEAIKTVDAAKAVAPASPLVPQIDEFRNHLEKKKNGGDLPSENP